MMDHDEANELLAALALNAVDSDVALEIEAHVATCPRCQSELDGYRAVAASLGNSVEPLPEGLWSNISSQLWERKGEEVPLPELVLPSAEVVAITSGRPGISRRTKTAFGALSFAAAASIIALAIGLTGANTHVANLQTALAKRSAVQSALVTPGHQLVNMSNSAQQPIAQFVMLPDGTGYLVKSHMPVLGAGQTYQLWGIVKGSPVSIGVMGNSPGRVTFTMAGSPAPTELAITVQQAGGSLTPSKNFVATGAV
jgi:Anti-sigma-K factor rskA/Putative zinc-finger